MTNPGRPMIYVEPYADGISIYPCAGGLYRLFTEFCQRANPTFATGGIVKG